MTQSKTSLILNNLVELTIPTCTDSKYLTFYENKDMGCLCVKLCFPFTFLLQKVQLEESKQESARHFNIEMITKHAVTHGQMRTIVHETEIIDFKKEKIDWRFKTRMRSNSNEFLDSPLAYVQKLSKNGDEQYAAATANSQASAASQPASVLHGLKGGREPVDSEDLSILSSDEEFDLKQDGKIILGNGISNQFTLYLSAQNSGSKLDDSSGLLTPSSNGSKKQLSLAKTLELFKMTYPSVRLFVWPTFRLPTGSSVIALINTSFLFATKRLEQERLEADFLVALSLISGRKFIQASEKLRKIQSSLLSHQVSMKTLIQSMNIEMIIGESMNQHSQISEKMFAFQRAVLFYKLAKRVEKQDESKGRGSDNLNAANLVDIEKIVNTKNKPRLKQEEAYKYLLKLQPHLVQVLLINIDSHIQAVRMASLKTLEFLFDTLGCNLDESLLQILVAIIKTYPSMTKRSNIPKDGKIISFFEDSWQLGSSSSSDSQQHLNQRTAASDFIFGANFSQKCNQNRFSPDSLGDPSQFSTFFSLNDIHSLKDCQVKDASLFHQSFIQTSKNFYNHILESMVFLIGSTSTPILVRIFNEVISKVVFQECIEPDLQIYLLRLSEKILTLCQGYVTVQRPFLNTLFELILSKNSAEVTGMAARGLLSTQTGPGEDSIAKVANDLWQTIKSSYLLNQSCEGITDFIQWVVMQFSALTEKVTSSSTSGSSNKDTNSDFAIGSIEVPPNRQQSILRDANLSVTDQQRLLLLIDLSNLLIYGQLRHLKDLQHGGQSKRKNNNRNLQKVAGREAFSNQFESFVSEAGFPHHTQQNLGQMRHQSNSCKFKLIALKMCSLIDPVIFWLNFTIERPDRLQYFKALWNTLTKLVQIVPKRKEIGVEFNCIEIILPTLQRVENFCQTSSPSLEMLQFLIIVFNDVKSFLLRNSRKKIKKQLFAFLDSFIVTFSQNIPHNLHDEVFEVCQLLIDLVGYNGFLSQHHIRLILEALVHKYTMRSKAHKRLSDSFLQTWILNHSLVQFEDLKKLEYQLVDQQYQQQQQISQAQQMQSSRMRTNSNQISSRNNNVISANRDAAAAAENAAGQNNSQSDQDEQSNLQQQQQYLNYPLQAQATLAQQQLNGNQPRQHTGSMESLHDVEQQLQMHQQQHVQELGAPMVASNLGNPQRSNSQPSNFLRHANLAPISMASMNENNESTQANENGSNRVNNLLFEHQQLQQHLSEVKAKVQQQSLYFDTLCEFSLFNNFLPSTDQFMSEQDQEQIYFEKLSVLQDVLEALKEEHNCLFKRLLHHKDFTGKVAEIFTNDRARSKIIKLMKSMISYFIKYNSPKTFYEHPLVQNSALPVPHIGGQQQVQQQTSARQLHGNLNERAPGPHSAFQFGHQLHSEPSMDLLRVMSQEDDMQLNNRAENGVLNDQGAEQLHMSAQDQIREQDLNLQRLNHHYSQHFERQQNNFLFNLNQNEVDEGDSPRIAASNLNMYLFDEVNLINNERLILIKTYTMLIRIYMEQMSSETNSQTSQSGETSGVAGKDSQSQLQALNMMDMLLYSLCPMPTFQNTVIRNLLNHDNMPLQGGGLNTVNNNGSGELPYQISQPHRLSFQFTGLNSMLGSQLGVPLNHEHQNDAIPDFETMLICESQQIIGLSDTQAQVEPNSFPKEFECWDLRYQHSRLALAFKVWPFVENAMLTSNWNNIKAACYSVICKVVQVPDVTAMSSNYQKRLKELLFPLLNKLLKCNESEGKAAGLNILGSFCGLASFQATSQRQSFEFSRSQDSTYAEMHPANQSQSQNNAVFDSDQGQDYHYDRYDQRQKEALSRNQIKIKDHLHVFRRNSQFVSLAIWQLVFEMQEDWNQQIRDAAEVLTQLCAPKESVKHFKKISEEKYQLHVCEAQSQLKQFYSSNKYLNERRKQASGSVGQFSNNHGVLAAGFNNSSSFQGAQMRSQFNSQSLANGLQNQNTEMLFQKQNSHQQLLSAQVGGLLANQFSASGVQFNQDFNLINEATMPKSGRAGIISTIQQQHNRMSDQYNIQNQNANSSSSESDEDSDEEQNSVDEEAQERETFFMEQYTERQLQQAISLFNADFKPITGLQAERTALASRVKSNKYRSLNFIGGGLTQTGQSIGSGSGLLGHEDDYLLFGGVESNPLIDFFEDNMLEEVRSLDSKDDDEPKDSKAGKEGQGAGNQASDRHQTTSQSDGEDLGIIDLDKQEGSEYDDFDQLDDEKLPILKNTYSKKNRPNNSKSVAIGSRSQGDVLRIRNQALQVLKAADEEIKVQIKEHPEMLSSLQRSFASQKSHDKSIFKIDLLHERNTVKRCLDDQNLHYRPENHDWLSSKSESADRIQKKRRIQSGKASSCLSEDQPNRGQNNSSSQYSKTNSSNGTSMEIGDIQIVMHQQQQQQQQRGQADCSGGYGTNFNHRHAPRNVNVGGDKTHERATIFYKDRRDSDEEHEIRSHDNKNKRQLRNKPVQKKLHVNRVGDLSDINDYNDKMASASDQDVIGRADEEYEVISAPVQRTTQNDIRENRGRWACSSAYKLSTQTGKISIDSLTELSSPYDEGSSSNKTLPPSANKAEEENSKRKSVNHLKTGKSNLIASKPEANSQQFSKGPQTSTTKKSHNVVYQHKVSMLSGQQQPQAFGSSNYLQSVIQCSSKQLNTKAQQTQSVGSSSQIMQQPISQKLSHQSKNSHQVNQSSHQQSINTNYKSAAAAKGENATRPSKHQSHSQHHYQPQQSKPGQAGSNTSTPVYATFNQSQLKQIQSKGDTQLGILSTKGEQMGSHQKQGLGNAHSQQVFVTQQSQQTNASNAGPGSQLHPSGGNKQSLASQAASKTTNNGARKAQQQQVRNSRTSTQHAAGHGANGMKEKRPNSLVVKHMPQQTLVQKASASQATTTGIATIKRNNFIVQSPRAVARTKSRPSNQTMAAKAAPKTGIAQRVPQTQPVLQTPTKQEETVPVDDDGDMYDEEENGQESEQAEDVEDPVEDLL